jgi:nicotinate (nicotinamide) nucleotide adenylyltransferase
MGKLITLWGGSFNPAHIAHVTMGDYLQEKLQSDETWMLFSINPDKDPAKYASLQHRMNMADIVVKHCNSKVILSDMEAKIADEKGKFDTFYILEGLHENFPDDTFIWAMGADSFASFHTWKERDDIMKDHIIAVVNRPGYSEAALNSQTAKEFSDQKIDITNPAVLRDTHNGWFFLSDSPLIDCASSSLIKDIQAGKTDFAAPFDQVADYIRENNLYGMSKTAKAKPQLEMV